MNPYINRIGMIAATAFIISAALLTVAGGGFYMIQKTAVSVLRESPVCLGLG